MKYILIFFLACFSVSGETLTEETRIMQIFFNDFSRSGNLYSQNFLSGISLKKLRQISHCYCANLGAFLRAENDFEKIRLYFEKGKVPCQISTGSGKIFNMWLGNFELYKDSLENISSDFKLLKGARSLCVLNENDPLLKLNSECLLPFCILQKQDLTVVLETVEAGSELSCSADILAVKMLGFNNIPDTSSERGVVKDISWKKAVFVKGNDSENYCCVQMFQKSAENPVHVICGCVKIIEEDDVDKLHYILSRLIVFLTKQDKNL